MAGAVERMGCAARSAQTWAIWTVRLPRKLAVRSAEGSASKRT